MVEAQDRVTELLHAIDDGDSRAADELVPLVYSELRRLAGARMAHEQPQTLDPTGLVHEAYLRLLGDGDVRWQNRAHFFAAAAEAMRRILIERARRYSRLRHGGDQRRVELHEDVAAVEPPAEEMLAIDEGLSELESIDATMASVVKLRFFAGLSVEEAAKALGVSERTVNRHWTAARAWLRRRVAGGEPTPNEGT